MTPYVTTNAISTSMYMYRLVQNPTDDECNCCFN